MTSRHASREMAIYTPRMSRIAAPSTRPAASLRAPADINDVTAVTCHVLFRHRTLAETLINSGDVRRPRRRRY